ncbi:hypothetical protein NL676_020043, partial [Syzygium grande]
MGTDEEEKRVRMKEATNVVGGVAAERSSLSAKKAIPLSVHDLATSASDLDFRKRPPSK